MKRILSLLVVLGMLCAMMVSVNAMNNDGALSFTSDVTEVTVGDTFTVKVSIKGDTDSAVKFKGGKVVVSATANATFDSAEVGDLVSGYGTQNLSTSTGALGISDTAGASGDGDYAVLTFTATEAGTFTISSTTVNVQFFIPGTSSKYAIKTALTPLNITIKDAAPAVPTAPATSKEENLRETAAGYDNVWVGKYSATAAADTKITSVGVKFAEDKKFSKAVESEGTVTFSIALIGVPENMDLFGEVVTTAEWK